MKTVGDSTNVGPALAPSNEHFNLGPHPLPPDFFGETLRASDTYTRSVVPHRALSQQNGSAEIAVAGLREMLIRHHTSSEKLHRTNEYREAMKRLGFAAKQNLLPLFPTNPLTM
jgi:hypothetical protein